MNTVLKKSINVIIVLATIAIISVAAYFGYHKGVPYLQDKSTYENDLPTIQILELKIDSLTSHIDSIQGVLTQIELASDIKGAMITDATKRNEALKKKYEQLADIFSRIPESELDAFIKQFNQ